MTEKPTCYELKLMVNAADKDAMVELLLDLGETAFVEGSADCDVPLEWEAVGNELYKRYAADAPIVLYSEDLGELEALRERIRERTAGTGLAGIEMVLQPIADQDWRESWKASFRPIDVAGTFCILPPWEDPADFPQPHKIVIDPGMAFGTGQHETTRLCLVAYLDLYPVGGKQPRRIFDVGTGSGILAIAAAMLGVEEIVGCDIDSQSVDLARDNAERNGIRGVDFRVGGPGDLHVGTFDLVIANIQVGPLKRIMGDMLGRLEAGGAMILSGILGEEAEDFSAFLEEQGVSVERREAMGDWVCLTCRWGG